MNFRSPEGARAECELGRIQSDRLKKAKCYVFNVFSLACIEYLAIICNEIHFFFQQIWPLRTKNNQLNRMITKINGLKL